MNIHTPTPSLLPHICTCGQRDSDPTWHRVPVATVSPKREPEPVAVARRTDPGTSWEAARSVRDLTEKQRCVLSVFKEQGPMVDEVAFRWYHYPDRRDGWPPQSVSGFRTRRSELVAKGLLRDTGERRRGSTGRRMIVWAAA